MFATQLQMPVTPYSFSSLLIWFVLNLSSKSSNQLWDVVLIDNQPVVLLKQTVVNFACNNLAEIALHFTALTEIF